MSVKRVVMMIIITNNHNNIYKMKKTSKRNSTPHTLNKKNLMASATVRLWQSGTAPREWIRILTSQFPEMQSTASFLPEIFSSLISQGLFCCDYLQHVLDQGLLDVGFCGITFATLLTSPLSGPSLEGLFSSISMIAPHLGQRKSSVHQGLTLVSLVRGAVPHTCSTSEHLSLKAALCVRNLLADTPERAVLLAWAKAAQPDEFSLASKSLSGAIASAPSPSTRRLLTPVSDAFAADWKMSLRRHALSTAGLESPLRDIYSVGGLWSRYAAMESVESGAWGHPKLSAQVALAQLPGLAAFFGEPEAKVILCRALATAAALEICGANRNQAAVPTWLLRASCLLTRVPMILAALVNMGAVTAEDSLAGLRSCPALRGLPSHIEMPPTDRLDNLAALMCENVVKRVEAQRQSGQPSLHLPASGAAAAFNQFTLTTVPIEFWRTATFSGHDDAILLRLAQILESCLELVGQEQENMALRYIELASSTHTLLVARMHGCVPHLFAALARLTDRRRGDVVGIAAHLAGLASALFLEITPTDIASPFWTEIAGLIDESSPISAWVGTAHPTAASPNWHDWETSPTNLWQFIRPLIDLSPDNQRVALSVLEQKLSVACNYTNGLWTLSAPLALSVAAYSDLSDPFAVWKSMRILSREFPLVGVGASVCLLRLRLIDGISQESAPQPDFWLDREVFFASLRNNTPTTRVLYSFVENVWSLAMSVLKRLKSPDTDVPLSTAYAQLSDPGKLHWLPEHIVALTQYGTTLPVAQHRRLALVNSPEGLAWMLSDLSVDMSPPYGAPFEYTRSLLCAEVIAAIACLGGDMSCAREMLCKCIPAQLSRAVAEQLGGDAVPSNRGAGFLALLASTILGFLASMNDRSSIAEFRNGILKAFCIAIGAVPTAGSSAGRAILNPSGTSRCAAGGGPIRTFVQVIVALSGNFSSGESWFLGRDIAEYLSQAKMTHFVCLCFDPQETPWEELETKIFVE